DGACDRLPEGPCGWRAWDLRAQSMLIQPTIDVYNAAKDRGAAIFFITGRDETQRTATPSSPTSVTNRRTSTAASPSRPIWCPIRSIAFLDHATEACWDAAACVVKSSWRS